MKFQHIGHLPNTHPWYIFLGDDEDDRASVASSGATSGADSPVSGAICDSDRDSGWLIISKK